MNVLTFQTNINTDQRVHRATCRLCRLRGVCRWSIDLEDGVLRIESESITETDVVQLLTRVGLQCHVLN